MTKFPSGAVTGLFVIAVVAVAAVNTSHASPLADLDNDAWTLERWPRTRRGCVTSRTEFRIGELSMVVRSPLLR